ncbi:hypothetical protein [Streptomonospora litoralis]|uniref:Uncharacterized protein n=1 Tax=Streptomonospora litoralis TaxID=2498135 RepID=A0A4P6Q2E6_9ACTN|nr:hypothetical protein [Streptomonospora litoralis]QBI53411.1 hypothetical protein EKD16_08085 [Streptomonospora litoralis]
MPTKAELEEENAELRQRLEDTQATDSDADSDGDARAEGYRQGYAAAAAAAADLLHQASGKNSPTVKRIRALGEAG